VASRQGRPTEKPTIFDRIYDFLKPIFSSRERFFRDIGRRGVETAPETQPEPAKKTGLGGKRRPSVEAETEAPEPAGQRPQFTADQWITVRYQGEEVRAQVRNDTRTGDEAVSVRITPEGGYPVSRVVDVPFKDVVEGEAPAVIAEEEVVPEQPAEAPTQEPERESGDPLADHFADKLSSGQAYTRITQAREEAEEIIGQPIKPGSRLVKELDEAVERGVVRAARQLVSDDPGATFDAMVDLYNRQPTLGSRTSTSMVQQAYSTPAPLAYLANNLAGVTEDTSVYDSSAGNGMLLVGANLNISLANELNPDRAQSLQNLGVPTENNDATEWQPDGTYDAVIINPPFGKLQEEDGSRDKRWTVEGIKTTQVDHAITLNSLQSMKEDGRAVVIIGSKGFSAGKPKGDVSRASAYRNQKQFYDTVYDKYNVVDHFTVSGSLYTKQGAKFPIDVIVIDGKGESSRARPYNYKDGGLPEVYNSWEDLKDGKLTRTMEPRRPSPGGVRGEGRPGTGLGPVLQPPGETPARPGGTGGRPGTRPGPRVERPGGGVAESDTEGSGVDGGRSGVPRPAAGTTRHTPERLPDEGQARPGLGSGGSAEQPGRVGEGRKVARPQQKETEFQVAYISESSSGEIGCLVPKHQVRAVKQALARAVDEHGSLDAFVAKELGYDDLTPYFSSEQVDALALMISNHKHGRAFILGDQTGVGKGRVAAGMMVYAKRRGLVPVFVTENPGLFADMVRDLTDIGQNTADRPFQPLATNTLAKTGQKDTTITLPDGRVMKQTAQTAKKRFSEAVASFVAGDGLKYKTKTSEVEYDAVFTTYSQLQPIAQQRTLRHEKLAELAPSAFFIMDESHKAGGGKQQDQQDQPEDEQRITGSLVARELLRASPGQVFLSATYAKRPEVMDLYARTGMIDAVQGNEEMLTQAIAAGGVPLQQVVSEMLVESGSYLRRERSFDGIEFIPSVVDVGLQNADAAAETFRVINTFDKEIDEAKAALAANLVSSGVVVHDDPSTGDKGVSNIEFSSIMWNLTDQMLLSLKAEKAAQAAVEAWKAGETPIIAVDNTMEAALKHYLGEHPTEYGAQVNLTFRDLLRRYLERSRQITCTCDRPVPEFEFGGATIVRQTTTTVKQGPQKGEARFKYVLSLTDQQIGREAVALYDAASRVIEAFSADMPASPIDKMRQVMTDAGMVVAEVTGRQDVLEYRPDGTIYLQRRPESEAGQAGKQRTIEGINNGTIDAAIINRSAATGLSIHASKKFKNQRRRHMFIAQAAKNVDEFMQILGRINRTGQIESALPKYTLFMSNAPAETRPASVLVKKLASLNANVTASAAGNVSFDAPDILNVIGDRIVTDYLADNPEINAELGGLVSVSGRRDGATTVQPGIARKVSGRIALMPVEDQQRFWDDVVEAFNAEIEQLNRLHKNPLAATTVPLEAKTLESFEVFEGDRESDSPFRQPAQLERVRAKRLGEPMSADEVKAAIDKFYGGEATMEAKREWRATQNARLRATAEQEYERRSQRLVKEDAKDSLRETIDGAVEFIQGQFEQVPPGAVVKVFQPGVGEFIPGIVLGLKPKSERASIARSGWTVEIALASPDRILRLPLNRFAHAEGDTSGGGEQVTPEYRWAEESDYQAFNAPVELTEERFVATGNILAGFAQLADQNGSVVFYTDDQGNTRRGVLMPRHFNADRWMEQRPVVFRDTAHVMRFLEQAGQVHSPDFAIQVSMDESGQLILRSPRSRQRSGQYTTDQQLLRAMGRDFVSRGAVMMATVPQDKAKATVDRILEIGSLQTGMQKDLARSLASSSPPSQGGGGTTARMAAPTRQSRSERRRAEGERVGIAAADIMKTAERLFGVAIRQGGFSTRAAGIYKWLTRKDSDPPSPQVARTTEDHYANLAVTAHEVAHHIDEITKAVNSMPAPVREEVERLDYEPEKGRSFEGWAEFLRRYMTEPPIDVNGEMVPNPGIDAPKTLVWFENIFSREWPEVAQQIGKFRKYAQQFAQQSVFQRIGSLISDRQPHDLDFKSRWVKKARRWVSRVKTNFIDKFHMLEWVQEEARERGHKGIGIYDLTMAHFMSASSHATVAFEEGVRSLQTGRPIGTTSLWGLREHLESDGEYKDAVLYALARHTLFMEEAKPGYNTGMDVEDAEAWIREVEASGKKDRYEAFAKGLAQFNNDLIHMLVEAGALPAKDADTMLKYYGGLYYFPLHRVQDVESSAFAGFGTGFVNLGKAVRKRSTWGSGRQIIDPIDATVSRAIKFYGRAIQARQQHVLAGTLDPKLGGVGGMGGLMDRVDARQKVTHAKVAEILKTLVDEGVVEANDARAMRIAAQILHPEETGLPSNRSLNWFAERHGIEVDEEGEMNMDAIILAAEKEPNALAVISIWRPDYTPDGQKRTVVIYDKQGNPLMYEMDADLYATATGMDDIQFGPFMSVLRAAARWFKTGAVGASTGFGTANLLRDYWEFQGKARHTKKLASLGKPPVMLGRYVAEKARKLAGQKADDPLIRLYEESGGKVYSVIGHDVHGRRMYRRRRIGKSTMSKLGVSIKRPLDTAEGALQAVQDIIAISDAPPRLADAEAAIREEGYEVRDNQWYDIEAESFVDQLPEHVRIKASIAMAEATINFKRIGAMGQYIESFMPFFNATVQATYRQYRQIKGLRNLGSKGFEGMQAKRYIVYLSSLAAYSISYWWLRHDDDDWRNQDAYLRDGYWTIGWNGKTYLRIPKPRDTAVIANLVENVLDFWYHDDARDTRDVLLRDFGGRMPTGGGLVRGVIETYVADYDYFRQRELTPSYLKHLPKEQQVTPYTTMASDAIGSLTGRYLGTSPVQVEHLLSSASGGFYRRMADLYDASVDGRLGPEHVPFLRGLVIDRHQTRPVNEFYEEKEALRIAAYRAKADKGSVSDAMVRKQAVLDGHAELMTTLRELESKRGKRRSYEYQPYVVGLARHSLGYKEQDSNPNPLVDKNAPKAVKDAMRDYSMRVVYQATTKEKDRKRYKNSDTYQAAKKLRISGEAKLKSLGISHPEALQLLKDYYEEKKGGVLNKATANIYDWKPSATARKKALQQLYGVQ